MYECMYAGIGSYTLFYVCMYMCVYDFGDVYRFRRVRVRV